MKNIFIILITCFVSCTSSEKKPEHLSNGFLYLYDQDGKDGVRGGNFGDIAFYDLENEKQYIMIKDNFYDEDPSYSKFLNRIYFQSERNYQTMTGITSEQNIFYFDIDENKIKEFDDEEIYSMLNINRAPYSYMPSISNNGKNLAFTVLSENNPPGDDIILYDIINREFIDRLNNVKYLQKIIWDEKDQFILFSAFYGLDSCGDHSYVGKFDISDSKYEELLSSPCQELIVADIKKHKLLLTRWDKISYKNYIEMIDLESYKIIYSFDIADFEMSNVLCPVFINEQRIGFIGVIENQAEFGSYDIYTLDMVSQKLNQITNDGHVKDHLKYIP